MPVDIKTNILRELDRVTQNAELRFTENSSVLAISQIRHALRRLYELHGLAQNDKERVAAHIAAEDVFFRVLPIVRNPSLFGTKEEALALCLACIKTAAIPAKRLSSHKQSEPSEVAGTINSFLRYCDGDSEAFDE